jgi:hypothetical protein
MACPRAPEDAATHEVDIRIVDRAMGACPGANVNDRAWSRAGGFTPGSDTKGLGGAP